MRCGRITKKYLRSYENLYGNTSKNDDLHVGNPSTVRKQSLPSKRLKSVKRISPSESDEQKQLVWWLKVKGIRHFHIPNGGSRGGKIIKGKWVPLEALKLKSMGTQRGIPDLCIPVPTRKYHGLYIEMKKFGLDERSISEEQINWINYLNHEGYLAIVAFGFEQGKKIVEEYLSCDILI